MSAESLSLFFQSPVNAAIFHWYPPQVLHGYMRLLGNYYFQKKPGEKERYLRCWRETCGDRIKPLQGRDMERHVLHGIFDHYFEKMLMAYWGLDKIHRLLLKKAKLVGSDLLDNAMGEGRGVILATGHFGAVEFLPATLAFRDYPISMVVKFKTVKLKRTLERFASIYHGELYDVADGQVIPKALSALRRGRILITELDEIKHWKASSEKVMNFFGRQVNLDRSVELLHRRTGAPILLGLMERVGRRNYQLVFDSPQEHLAAPTGLGPDAQLLKQLEHYIYDAPDHWYIWNDLHHLEQLQTS